MNLNPSDSRILCAGRLYCDLVFTDVPGMPRLGTETFAGGLGLHAGGGAFITAAAFQALGWPSALCAYVPAAPFDRLVLDEVERNGIDTRFCLPALSTESPQITVAIATGGDRAFLSHKTGAAVPDIDLNSSPVEYRHLHIGELRTLCEHPGLIDLARSKGMSISLDCAWDEELFADPRNVADLISKVDVFLPNESEHDQLVALGISAIPAPLTVVKCGASGSKALQSDSQISMPVESVDVVDATGAGDAFNGGFLVSWLSGASMEECLARGNACGAAVIQSSGGTASLSGLAEGSSLKLGTAAG